MMTVMERMNELSIGPSQLCVQTGLSPSTVRVVMEPDCTSQRSIRPETAKLVADALGLPVNGIDWGICTESPTGGLPGVKIAGKVDREENWGAPCPVHFTPVALTTGQCDLCT